MDSGYVFGTFEINLTTSVRRRKKTNSFGHLRILAVEWISAYELTFFFAIPMTVKNAIAIIPKQHVAIIKCSMVFAKAPSKSPILTSTLPPTLTSFSFWSFRSVRLIVAMTSLCNFDKLSNSYKKMRCTPLYFKCIFNFKTFQNRFNKSDITG